MLPEGDPPQVGPLWQPLVEEPCRQCGGRRLFAEGMKQAGIPAGPAIPGEPDNDALDRLAAKGAGVATLTLTTLCGDCGDVHERRGWNIAT